MPSVDRNKHPYREWYLTSLVYLVPYSVQTLLWSLNLAFDHNAGFLDKLYLLFASPMQFLPLAAVGMSFYTATSYGTEY